MFLFQTRRLWYLSVCFFTFVSILAVKPAEAATIDGFVGALDLAAQVEEYSLITATETGSGACTVSAENAETDLQEKSIVISNGDVNDGGLGDTDFVCSDDSGLGLPDYSQFQMRLNVNQAKSLVFRTQFITSEYEFGPQDVQDRAFLYVTLQPSAKAYTIDLAHIESVVDKTSPGILRSIDVEGETQIEVSFRIEDRGDGSSDSAIKLMDIHFSDEATTGDQVEYLPEDVKLPSGTYRYSKQLLYVPGKGIPLDFTIHYNSRNSRTRYFFRKWTHSYEWSMRALDDGRLLLMTGDGGSVYFCPTADDNIYAECNDASNTSFENAWEGASGRVVINDDDTYTYTNRKQMTYEFSSGGFLKSMVDTNGNTLAFSYFPWNPNPLYCGGRNYLDTITDTRGGTLQLYYSTDPINFCSKMLVSMEYLDPNDVTLHFISTTYQHVQDCYNHSALDLGYVSTPSGQTLFSYDCSGNLLTATDPDGVVYKTNTYAGERVASSTDGKGAVESYAYFKDSIEHTDRLGRVHHKYFDIQDRLIRRTNPVGDSWHYANDASGNVISQTDPLGNMTIMTYDGRGNRLSSTDALGNTTGMTYDSRNNLVTAADTTGHSTTYTYDDRDNLLQKVDRNGHITSYTYNAAGQRLAMTDPMGNTFQYEYEEFDDGGDMERETDPLGNLTSYYSDSRGRMTSRIDPRSYETTFAYDRADNLVLMTLPDGATVSYTYDSQGRMLSLEKANGAVTKYAYSGTGKMLQYEDPLGNIFHSGYDAEDQLVSQIDPMGRITAFEYDDAGRMVQVADASGGITKASYNAVGNRTSVTDPNGNTTLYEYDALGRITMETDPLGNIFENVYDARGHLERFTNGRGDLVSFHYDAGGRLDSTDFPTYTLQKTLDAKGNTTQTTGKDDKSIQRSFDALGRLINRTDPFGNTIRYSYDATGNLEFLTYSDGQTVHYAYDSRNRMVKVTDWDGNETAYAYDAVGHLASVTRPDGSVVAYTYDIAGQMLGITDLAQDGAAIFEADYQYNSVGLRTAAEYHALPLAPNVSDKTNEFTYNAANQIAQMNGVEFSYDPDGNLTKGMIGDVLKDMAYDELNRLIHVGQDAYEYDPEGLRIQAITKGKTVRYVQDPNASYARLLEEHDDQGNIIARYVYGVGLISRQGQSGTMSVYHYDSRGSTIALTDPSGTITDRYAYDPYGHGAGREGNTPNPFTYNGRDGVMDDGNGLYYMRARYYESRLMRFIQKDAAVSGNMMHPPSLNRYAYVMGNPVQFVDPGGEILPILIGMAVGVATEIAIDWATGEFNPLEDDWGAYLEDNWVDLSVSAVLGGLGPAFTMAKNLKYLKIAKYIKAGNLLKFTKKCKLVKSLSRIKKFESVYKWTDRAINVYAVYGLYDAYWDDVSDPIGDAAGATVDWVEGAAEDTADWVEGAAEDTVDWAEDAGNAVVGAGKSAYNAIRSIF